MAESFRVLSLDGGGMRGLYTATLLSTLAYRFDERFSDQSPDIGKAFDLICGTSTGAILACGLAYGVPISEIKNLYATHGKEIFSSPFPDNPSKATRGKWYLKHLKKPSASGDKLKEVLHDIFGNTTIKELYDKRGISICVPTINASNYFPWVFKTPHNTGKHRDNNYALVDVCLASSAAPTFFSIAQFQNPDEAQKKDSFVDGGLWANNPVIVGMVEALGLLSRGEKKALEIVSVGTCDRPQGVSEKLENPNWGLCDWEFGRRIVEMSLASQSAGYGYIANFLAMSLGSLGLEARVERLQVSGKSSERYKAIGIDKADNSAIQELNAMALEDADTIHSKSHSGDYSITKDIFSNLDILS